MRRLDAPGALGRGHEQAVVGPDEEPAVGALQHEGAPVGADARVDHGDVDADRHVRDGVGERSRARRDVARRHAVSEVQHARVRRDAEDRTLHDAGVGVARTEIREERDKRHESTLPAPRTLSMPRMRTSR